MIKIHRNYPKKNSLFVLTIFLLALTVFISFSPTLKNKFTSFDDDKYITQNPDIREFSWKQAKTIFSSFHYGLYKPMVLFSYSIEYHFFKLNPIPYHCTNILLHVLNTLGVFWFIYLISKKNFLVSLMTALLFGIHPLHVESVAWVTERKDVLYSLFYLSGLIGYVYFLRAQKAILRAFVLVCFILSLLSKPMAITLPFILLLLDVWQGRKFDKNRILEKSLFFILGACFGLMNVSLSYLSGKIHPFNLIESIQAVSYAPLFYIYKIFLPTDLSCVYPYPERMGFWGRFFFYYAPFILAPLLILIFRLCRRYQFFLFGILFFSISILPVVQIASFGVSVVADHYVYLASIGIFYIFSETFYRLIDKKRPFFRRIVCLGMVPIFPLLLALTWNQCKVWRDSGSLWDHTIKNYPMIPLAYYNRGLERFKEKRFDEALEDLLKAKALDPGDPEIYFFLGNIYFKLKNYGDAIMHYHKAIDLQPTNRNACYNLAQCYFTAGLESAGAFYLKRSVQ